MSANLIVTLFTIVVLLIRLTKSVPVPTVIEDVTLGPDDTSTPGTIFAAGPCQRVSIKNQQQYYYNLESNSCFSRDEFDRICPEQMTLHVLPENETIGFCDCKNDPRPTVYNNITKQCQFLFLQEYCMDGYWLQLDNETGNPTCTLNPCQNLMNQQGAGEADVALYKGKCAVVGGFFSPECQPNYLLRWIGGSLICFPKGGAGFFGVSVPHLRCSKGTRWSALTQSCSKVYKIKFS